MAPSLCSGEGKMEITKEDWRESQNLDEDAQKSYLHWRSALYGLPLREAQETYKNRSK
jgi:hypothetical protein